jgi:hypothetical protein
LEFRYSSFAQAADDIIERCPERHTADPRDAGRSVASGAY